MCSPTRTSALHLCAVRVLVGGSQPEAVAVAGLLLDRTALHLAAWAGAADLLELLLKRYQVSGEEEEEEGRGALPP